MNQQEYNDIVEKMLHEQTEINRLEGDVLRSQERTNTLFAVAIAVVYFLTFLKSGLVGHRLDQLELAVSQYHSLEEK